MPSFVSRSKTRLWREDAQGYFRLLEGVASKHGLPLALYSDRHGIFVRSPKESLSIEEELRGEREPTQFGRLLKELEIEPIFALSPQAKGRVERLWGTFQDRLVSELRLAGARTQSEASEVLEGFLRGYNKRFVVEPREKGTAYRALPAGMKPKEVFCFKYERRVANDNTVRLGGRIIQIGPGPGGRSYAKAKVIIHERMDGSLGVYYQGQRIAYEESVGDLAVLRVKSGRAKSEPGENLVTREASDSSVKSAEPVKSPRNKTSRPPANHPWYRKGLAGWS